MKSKLSTDELFHFTKFDRLINIIKEGFYPRYNFEHTFLSDLFNTPSTVAHIPMVCFCDIPLNMVQEHYSKYGKCAIGLDKKWGEKYGLNPIIYVHKNSRIGDAISAIANSISNYRSSMISEDSDISVFKIFSSVAKGFAEISYLVKQYERTEDEHNYIGSKWWTFKKGRFYDEREWRFVPPNLHNDLWLIDANTFDNEEELEKAHEKIKKYSLKFDIDDIKFIVSETDEEKNKLILAIADRFDVSPKTATEKITFKRLDETVES